MSRQTSSATRVTIIIPHYNQKECLERLLPSVDAQTFKDFEVIIIDDCTPDEGTVSFIKDFVKDRPNMHLVQNTENMRFIKTCNKGIRLAKGEYICLLNSDTEIKSTFVERNVEVLDSDASIGALSCIVVDRHGHDWFCGGRYMKGIPINLENDFNGELPVDWIAGTAAFYRRAVFEEIGLFDESLIMYHEDVEYGLRMRAKTGYRACMISDRLVTHFLVPSIARIEVCIYSARNSVLLSRKYAVRYLPNLVIHIIVYDVCKCLVIAVGARLLRKQSSTWESGMRSAIGCTRGLLRGLVSRQRPALPNL